MNRRQYIAAIGASASTLLAGCGSGSGSSEPEGDVAATITMTEDRTYDPMRVSIEPGEAVEWVNETSDERTVESNQELEGAAEWEAEITVPAGESGTHTFGESGIYSYNDRTETYFNMCGAVAVGQSEDDIGSLPCE